MPNKKILANAVVMDAGGVSVPTYAEILRDTYGASEIWPLVNISSGTTISAFINSARNGTLTGWDLKNAAGPVTGTLAPYSDGVNDFGNIYSASLNSIFDGAEGGISILAKNDGWAAGFHNSVSIRGNTGTNNQIIISSSGVNHLIIFRANSTSRLYNADSGSPSGWVMLSITWSDLANQVKIYINDTAVVTDTKPAWNASDLDSTICNIGSLEQTPSNVYKGWLSYLWFKFGGVPDIAGAYSKIATAGADV